MYFCNNVTILCCKPKLKVDCIVTLLFPVLPQVICGSVDDTKKALTQVEQQLGKNMWLVEDKFTIADVVMFSAIRVSKSIGLLSHNLKMWYKSIEAKYC